MAEGRSNLSQHTLMEMLQQNQPRPKLKLPKLTWRQRRELRRLKRQHAAIYFCVPQPSGRKTLVVMLLAVAAFITCTILFS